MITRRHFIIGSAAGAAGLALPGRAEAFGVWRQAAVAGAPAPQQVHLTYGDDPRSIMNVTWYVASTVGNPRVVFGTPAGGYGTTVAATTRSYVNTAGHVASATVTSLTAALVGLAPGTTYVYEVTHDGATAPVMGSFTTAPAGRQRFTFTSFGDQGAPATDPVSGNPIGGPIFAVPQGTEVVAQIEAIAPLFHLVNGDLCYGNLAADPVTTWDSFFNNNQASAMNRPWMPTPGNHENEPQTTVTGDAPPGYAAYLSRFPLPSNGSGDFQGLWYSFDVGNVRFVALNGDDACYQSGGSSYIMGYSHGAQAAFLEQTLAQARQSGSGIDWIVVFQHQTITSSSMSGNGSDLGLRQTFAPLFDAYDVDLILCGHEHDYERSFPVHGVDQQATLRPAVVTTATTTGSGGTDVVDSVGSTVNLILGGGGCNVPTNTFYGPTTATDMAKVLTGSGETDFVLEDADWSSVRDAAYPYGFGRFDVDPGAPGGQTTITATYLRTLPTGATEYDTVTLTRPVQALAAPTGLPESPAAVLVPAAAVLAGVAVLAGGRRLVGGDAGDAGDHAEG